MRMPVGAPNKSKPTTDKEEDGACRVVVNILVARPLGLGEEKSMVACG